MNPIRKNAAISFFHHKVMSDLRRYGLFLFNILLLGFMTWIFQPGNQIVAACGLISCGIVSATFWISENRKHGA
jgi:hypothetical protein